MSETVFIVLRFGKHERDVFVSGAYASYELAKGSIKDAVEKAQYTEFSTEWVNAWSVVGGTIDFTVVEIAVKDTST